MSKHDPGPWESENHNRTFADWRVWTGTQYWIPPSGMESTEANSRLIAAAPDLLAALEWALSIVQFDLPRDDHVCGPDAGCDGECSARASMVTQYLKARNVIKRAREE